MDGYAPTSFIRSINARLRQRSFNSAGGSAASSVALGEVARCSPDEALQRLGSSVNGLTTKEADVRLRSVGPNEVAHEVRHTILGEIITRSMNPLNLLLLTLSTASYFIGDQRAAIVIAIMVLLSVSLGFFQEHRSTKAAEALRRMVQNNATVHRQDGGTANGHCDVPIGQLIPGDVVLLSAGDMIPADLRLISAKDLFINQSTLTGEAMPLEKNAQPHAGKAETPFDLPNICFMGSAVVSGVGCGVVVLTGARTAFGKVAGTIAEQRVLTSFDKGVTRVTWMMLGLILIMVPLVFVINGLSKGNWFEALLFAVAVAVGLTPEIGQPNIVTDLPGDDVIVACEDLHPHATGLQSGDGRSGRLFRWVEERDVAEQRELGLVRDGIRHLRWRHLLESHCNDPKAVGVQLGRRLLCLPKVALIENRHRVIDGVARANRKNFLDRTLADEDVSVVTSFENDRHSAPLEIKRDLVDLAEPLVGLELLVEVDVLQHCDVE